MSLETLVPYVVNHNAVIIQVLTALILFFVGVMAVRSFRASGEASAAAGTGLAGLENLEETLKKLLDKAQSVPATAGSGDQAQLVAEINTLRASLQEKQDQIEQMKLAPVESSSGGEAAAATAPGLSSEDKTALESQIRDLQAKLSEYEIISEDIADLSFYKEENSKLQKEIESLKKGGANSGAVPPPTAAPAAPARVEASTAQAEVPQAATPAPQAQPEVMAQAAPPAVPKAQVETPAAAPTPTKNSAEGFVSEQDMVDALMATPAEDLAAGKAGSPGNVSADEDLMKEFAEAVSAQGGEEIAAEESATLPFDVERMTQEASVLEKVAESAAEVSEENLNAGLDAERLTAEAANMEQIKPEDAKLMGDFEDFMKKGGGA